MDIHGSPTFVKNKNKLAQADSCLSRATVVDLETHPYNKNSSSIQDTYRFIPHNTQDAGSSPPGF